MVVTENAPNALLLVGRTSAASVSLEVESQRAVPGQELSLAKDCNQ